jgi:trehalose/maltose hydrolase-like predicted phosphorylase
MALATLRFPLPHRVGVRPGPALQRRTGCAATALTVLAGCVLTAPAHATSRGTTAPTQRFASVAPSAGSGWELATTVVRDAAAAPAYVGNGYLGTRIPADGAGYVSEPVTAETHLAGVYADVPDPRTSGTQHQGSVNLPGWTQLDVVVAGRRYTAATATGYRQSLDLRRGVVTTTARWKVGSRVTDLRYEVMADRARSRVGLVRLRVTPHWSGSLTVRDVIGAGSGLTPGALRPVTVTAAARQAVVSVRTKGTDTTVAEVGRLRVPSGAVITARAKRAAMSATRTARFPVRAGQAYEVAKVVGFATSLDTSHPQATATRAATGAPKPSALLAESATAWRRLWASDIVLPGQPELQRRVRAAQFYLLASARAGVEASISPVGLSAGGYNNHIFWDAETWMYPALLAQHPAEAAGMVDYRYRTRAGAERNARRTGYAGLRYAWESALTGDEVTPTWAETGRLEQHVTADVALAQWQYYLATGDRQWLRSRGWPVLRGAADFWASRAEPGADGRLHITQVEGPDEQNWPVDDSVYTNATAASTLRIATRAARLLGTSAPARWADVASRLVVLEPVPLGGQPAVRPEFRGYNGQQVKQADVVLLSYPWEYQQPARVDRSNLEFYTARYDPDGPAMTDSASSVVAAQLGGDCSAWTFTRRSVDPFVKPPYEQFTEARSGQGVFTFLTGEGGFLQEFLYGYTGLRWREDRLQLNPMLPPQLPGGVHLTGLRWQGRVFDLAVDPGKTAVTLSAGPPLAVESPAGSRTVSVGSPLLLPTRTAGATEDDVVRCQRATANAADPSGPAAAAVDGSLATAWWSGTDPAVDTSLTVELRTPQLVSQATLSWQHGRPLAPYTLQVRSAGVWRTVATVPAASRDVDPVSFPAVTAQAVRVLIPATRYGGAEPRLAELALSP